MEWSRKAACIIDGPSLRAVQRGEGVVNGPEQAGLGGVGVGATVGVWEVWVGRERGGSCLRYPPRLLGKAPWRW